MKAEEMEVAEFTYVDRVDTSQIRLCGHRLPVKRRERLGVTIFYHLDGQPCALLNSLCLDGDTVNREDTRLAEIKKKARSIIALLDDPEVYARLPTDKEIASLVAKELDREKDPERFTEALLKIARCRHAVESFRAIRAALSPRNQRLLMKNIVTLFSMQYADGTATELHHLCPLLIEAQDMFLPKKPTGG